MLEAKESAKRLAEDFRAERTSDSVESQERDRLSASEALQLSEELQKCHQMIAVMKSSGEQHKGLLSSREEELQHCKLQAQEATKRLVED